MLLNRQDFFTQTEIQHITLNQKKTHINFRTTFIIS